MADNKYLVNDVLEDDEDAQDYLERDLDAELLQEVLADETDLEGYGRVVGREFNPLTNEQETAVEVADILEADKHQDHEHGIRPKKRNVGFLQSTLGRIRKTMFNARESFKAVKDMSAYQAESERILEQAQQENISSLKHNAALRGEEKVVGSMFTGTGNKALEGRIEQRRVPNLFDPSVQSNEVVTDQTIGSLSMSPPEEPAKVTKQEESFVDLLKRQEVEAAKNPGSQGKLPSRPLPQ